MPVDYKFEKEITLMLDDNTDGIDSFVETLQENFDNDSITPLSDLYTLLDFQVNPYILEEVLNIKFTINFNEDKLIFKLYSEFEYSQDVVEMIVEDIFGNDFMKADYGTSFEDFTIKYE